ncbi:hypothetical protein VD0002_g5107 [Verticillium dahliae]|uniref:Uncharacterized protein n=2 Tax=Verticillium dahliae TaxID=27337 RepID=G2XB76_VERDV|nr:uncharacterized protein VDAG_07214 [Verticillium dahliae VdLs.17]KAF3349273.1 hypothetical protein VdG2_02530 [Verticillium dahliae VDG2]KAH6687008.1 hypothetical protein EV126DRAFT_433108 [Verticillium dahliae]EGY16050.1 hypothetical protein VDAG_07214 [Verticillium dahliae VdLs.17]PNH30109.1 hypothetical protein BJF96_g6497 [Verticillium dahliae]PNH57359.1 hypothetical protein VD0003_g514 [Verticillium dahliae]
MSVIEGYKVGEIAARAAFTSDIILADGIDLTTAVSQQEFARRQMDTRKGMYIKYVPYQPHSVTGQAVVGGRYLFDTWDDALDYDDWTTNVFETGDPPQKFWSSNIFQKVDRWIWRVSGACQFFLPETHGFTRFQRWEYDGDNVEEELRGVYPSLREAAKARGAAGIWLFYQPDAKLIGILTIMKKPEVLTTKSLYEALEDLKAQPSFGSLIPSTLSPRSVFDNSALILAMWLPVSRSVGGANQDTPLAPVLPSVTT